MSDATSTPVDKANEPPIRAEITSIRGLADLLQSGLDDLKARQDHDARQRGLLREAVGSMADKVNENPNVVKNLVEYQGSLLRKQLAEDRERDARKLADMFATERARVDAAIMASERRSDAKISAVTAAVVAVDSRVDELSLKVGAHAEEVTGVTQVLVKRVDEHESFFQKNKEPIAASFGSTGIALAVFHVAPVIWGWFKAWAVTKGWTAP